MMQYLKKIHSRGFTLLETLVAVSLLVVAIVAPMSLVAQSLASAYYARDQVAAYALAQEAIEAVRAVRDGNILNNAMNSSNLDLMASIIPSGNTEYTFTIDTTLPGATGITACPGTCPFLRIGPPGTDDLYGYTPAWTLSKFRRTVHAKYIPAVPTGSNEIRITVTVDWITSSGNIRSFQMYSNMYRWVADGAAN